ncbi:GFA family protein [Methylophaga sulfidovorans]|uniref:Uncharacterized conserved protein n=1 Tax=Methylophaga sulfidovorans TaxID=45496 RepID=A0A1I3Z960_9GAMM|nr:GFA family protein [Methylophaga sulfidovorans]SFK40166.1 Uncharacterized conserved protein [Methylophaga sulfidovorans]
MLKGSCLCQSVQYEIDDELGPTMICHCENCRKTSGSAYAINAAVETSHFHLKTGMDAVAEYESSPGVFRVFCQHCGSQLYSKRATMPEIIRLRLGTLDTVVDIKPQAHIFVSSKAAWHQICDDIPQFAERP